MPPPDNKRTAMHIDAVAVLEDIRRTGQLIEEFHRLKKYGGNRAALERMKIEISRLKEAQRTFLELDNARKKKDVQHNNFHASSSRSDGLMITPRSRSEPRECEESDALVHIKGRGRVSCASQTLTEEATDSIKQKKQIPQLPNTSSQNMVSSFDNGKESRRYCSVVFAVILAEAHTRREIIHKYDRRRIKLLSHFREGKIIIALSKQHQAHSFSADETLAYKVEDLPQQQQQHESQHSQKVQHRHLPQIDKIVSAPPIGDEYNGNQHDERNRRRNPQHIYSNRLIEEQEKETGQRTSTSVQRISEYGKARYKIEQEETSRNGEEAEPRRITQEEEEARRKAEEEEARRKAEEEEEARRKAEEEETKRKGEHWKNNCKGNDEGSRGDVASMGNSSVSERSLPLRDSVDVPGDGYSYTSSTCEAAFGVDHSASLDVFAQQQQVFNTCELFVSEWISASFDVYQEKNSAGSLNIVPHSLGVTCVSSNVDNNVVGSVVSSFGKESSMVSARGSGVLVTGFSRDASLNEAKPEFMKDVRGSFTMVAGKCGNTDAIEGVKVNSSADNLSVVSADDKSTSLKELPVLCSPSLCVAPGANKGVGSSSAVEEAVTGYVVEMAGAAIEALGDPSGLSYANLEMVLRRGIFDAASAATKSPGDLSEEWRGGLRALAERIASDYIYFAWKSKLRKLDECLWHTEAFYTPEEIAARAVEVVAPRGSFESLQRSDVRFLTNYYVELARKGGLNESMYTEARLRENLFERRADSVASPVLPFPLTSLSNKNNNNKTSGGRSMLTVDRRRAGLTQLVLGHALDNILEDIVADTTKWIASLAAK